MQQVSLRTVSQELATDWMRRFYAELLEPNFGRFPEELEDLETFTEALKRSTNTPPYTLHVLLLHDEISGKLMAGCAFEFYPKSCCGLLTYIAVQEQFQGRGLGKQLVEAASRELTRVHGQLNAFFLETNSDAVDAERDVLRPAIRRMILGKLGFYCLDFAYVQPPLSPALGKCRDLLLAVHERYLSSEKLMDARVLLEWVEEFFHVLMGSDAETDVDLEAIRAVLVNRHLLPIITST